MRKLIAALLAAAALAVSAFAQSPPYPPSMPSRTVVGNMGPVAGPGTSVPLSVLQALILYGETPVSDANYSIPTNDPNCNIVRTVAYTALTASRTVTLNSASCYAPGTQLFFFDRSGNASSTKTVSVAPTGADLINGVNAANAAINSPYVIVTLESDGVSKWTASAALSTTLSPFFPVFQPSSGNFQGSGNPTAHQLVWSDANPQFNADVMQFYSSDPSASTVITLGGTPVAGDLYTLNFNYNSGTVSVFYTVQSGDTIAKVINQLVCAIANNATLFNLNGGTCSTSTGLITPAAGTSYGGYANGALIGYIVPFTSTTFAFDHNSTVSTTMSYTVSGANTETITFPKGMYAGTLYTGGTTGGSANAQTVTATGFTYATGNNLTFTAGFTNSGSATLNVNSLGAKTIQKYVNGALTNLSGSEIASGTQYTAVYNGTVIILNANSIAVAGGSSQSTNYQLPNALDNNPVLVWGRNSGAPPAAGSVLQALYATGAQTGNAPTQRTVNYGVIANFLGNASTGALQDAWLIQNANAGGTWFGNGVYANSGCDFAFAITPITTCFVDKGAGTTNFAGYWVQGTANGTGAELYQTSSTIRLDTFSTAWPIILNSTGGVGINGAPSANGEFNSSLGAFFTGAQLPSTGTGVAINFSSSNGAIIAENFGTSTFKQLILQGSPIQLAPSGNGSQGVNAVSNEFYPTTDNQVVLGDTSTPHRWQNVATMTATFGGSSSGNTTLQASATASGTLTLPAATDTLAALAATQTLTNKTLTSPLISTVIGGTAAGASLELRSTSGTGSGDKVFVTGGTNGGTTLATFNGSAGTVGLGSGVAPSNATVAISGNAASVSGTLAGATTYFQIVGADSVSPNFMMNSFGSSAPSMVGFHAAGTGASPTAVGTSATLFNFGAYGYDGASYDAGAFIAMTTTQTFSAGNNGTKMILYASPNNGTLTAALTLQSGIFTGAATGGDEGAGTINAAGAYYQNGTIGVTCSGSPTASFASKLGIVTHC